MFKGLSAWPLYIMGLHLFSRAYIIPNSHQVLIGAGAGNRTLTVCLLRSIGCFLEGRGANHYITPALYRHLPIISVFTVTSGLEGIRTLIIWLAKPAFFHCNYEPIYFFFPLFNFRNTSSRLSSISWTTFIGLFLSFILFHSCDWYSIMELNHI